MFAQVLLACCLRSLIVFNLTGFALNVDYVLCIFLHCLTANSHQSELISLITVTVVRLRPNTGFTAHGEYVGLSTVSRPLVLISRPY